MRHAIPHKQRLKINTYNSDFTLTSKIAQAKAAAQKFAPRLFLFN